MKRKTGILARSVILTFLLTLLLGSFVVHAETAVDDEAKEPKINYAKYTVNLGDEDDVLQLQMENLGDKKPRWISYNVNVATVDQDGVVTPLRKGTAIISSGIGFPRKICVVTVVDPSVKLNKAAAALYRSVNETTPGDTITLTAKVNGATKDAKDVVWSSSDTSVAKVEKDAQGRGVVKSVGGEAGKAGTAVITARVNGRTASCKVTVLKSSISLNVKEMQLSTKGAGSSIKLMPTVVGAKKAVAWTSSDKTIATVSGGKVTGKNEGEATVTATANGVSTTCKVTVKAEQISISEEKVQLYVTKNASGEPTGETKELQTNAAGSDAVTWTSSDETIVKVEGQTKIGKITAVGAGTATITATCNDKADTCVVEVKNTATSIAEKVVHLKTGGAAKTYTLGYQVTGRSNKVTWKSDKPKVVSVSKGKVTAKKAGTATVTMTANGVEDKVQVIVQDYTPTIALNQKEYTLYTKGTGNLVKLKATVSGEGKKVVWQSNNASVAEVNAKGTVTAKAKGRALITATANGVTAKCWVNVKEPKIILERNAFIIKPGEKGNLCDYASLEVTGGKQSVTYKSSDVKTVSVDKKGNITGKKAGQATITLKANGVEETCDVTVSACETHVWVDATDEKYAEYNRPAACEETGLSCKECSVCHGKDQIVTPPLGHSFGRWTVVAWSTENAAGLERQVCTICKEENTRIIPAKNKGEQAYGYKLVWEDDFNGAELDRSFWNVELHAPGWVNNELQSYVDSDQNIYVKDGKLVIQALKDKDGNYTSGRVNTQNKQDYRYGRFEAMVKVPNGKGFLPAFWMMPTDESYYGQWPKCGEIDIMEVLGDKTNKAYSTLHFGNPHTEKQGSYEGEDDFSEDFHVYACEWDPDEFRFYVDDKLFYTVNDWFTKKDGFPETAYPAPYDQPFYMILNLAVGGNWPGNPDETTEFGNNAQLVVDYVRVYQKDEYDTNVSKPGTDVQLRDPDATGNYIINGDFTEPEELAEKGGNWQLLLAAGGAATAENSDGVLNITQTAAGTENHSVQIVQAGLPIEKSCSYKLSYDAYADAERTMITNVTGPDKGYIRYLADKKVTLTTEKQPFEHTFEMTSDSDANGRVEFNLGNQNSTAAVHIDNVRLEKLGVVEEEEEVKDVLPDGNYVYNGAFNEGNAPGRLRLDYWDWKVSKAAKGASVSVTNDSRRELKVAVPESVSVLEDVVVYQKPIAITGGKAYKLSFDARADQAKTIKAAIAGKTFESALTTEKKEYTYEFDTAEDLNGSELRFLLGAPGTTYIDNVSIKKVGADTGLIVNGDFSGGLTGFEPYVDSNASASYTVDRLNEDDAFSIEIADTGALDWHIQLKQNNIKLEKDKWYKLSFDAKSTMERKIMYALQRDGSKHKTEAGGEDWTPYSGSQKIGLKGSYQTFSHTFKMTEGTDPETILSISMGAVDGTQITTKHTVVIDNITLVETEPEEIPPVVEGKEMIANGDFSEGEAHWEKVVLGTGAAEAEFTNGENGKATYKITNVGTEDWHIQLKHKEKLTLEKDAEYAVKFKIKSTAARTVKYAFMGTGDKWYGGEDLSLTAGEVKEVNSKVKVTEDTSNQITFQISMGQIYDHWDASIRKPIDTPISTIEIDDISVKKIGGTGGEEPEPDDPVEIGTELIKNGDFAAGKENWIENPACEGGVATFDVTGEKALFNITNVGTQSYSVQLKQEGLTLEKGAKYKVSFKIKSNLARDVIYKFQENGGTWADYGTKTISLEANSEGQTVDEEITVNNATSSKILFFIGMGKIGDGEITTPHTIEIDDVSVKKISNGSGDDPSGDDPVEFDTELITNGDFAKGEAGWSTYFAADAAKAERSFANDKVRYEITNVGTNFWDIVLKQEGLTMEKDASYKVNFKIGSSIGRDVKLEFQDDKYQGQGYETISLKADTLKSVSRIVTLDKDFSGKLAFQLSLGNDSKTDFSRHAIEISNISVKKVEAGTKADTETEEDVTIEPPAGSGDDPKPKPDDPEDAENLIKNGDFAKWEDDWNVGFYPSEGETAPTGKADLTHGKARYEITNAGTADWNVQLKQESLEMEKGASYKVNFKIGSSIDRKVKLAIMGASDAWCGGSTIELAENKLKSYSQIVTLNENYSSGTVALQISMGNYKENEQDDTTLTKLVPHAIEIFDISVKKVEAGTTADTETEKDVTIAPPAENLIENGDFASGKSGWSDYIHTEGGAEATPTFADSKARYEITNAGTADWNVQLKQEGLEMEKGASYKVNFKIGSSIDRKVKLAIMGASDAWCGGSTIELAENKLKSYSQIVTLNENYSSGTVALQISMGNYKENEQDDTTLTKLVPHAIEIFDISVKKVEAGTTADTETEKDVTIAPPSEKKEEPDNSETETPAPTSISADDTDGDSDAVVKEKEDDQDPENSDDQDDVTEDTTDEEDADSADQKTSDEQTGGDVSKASDDSVDA